MNFLVPAGEQKFIYLTLFWHGKKHQDLKRDLHNTYLNIYLFYMSTIRNDVLVSV